MSYKRVQRTSEAQAAPLDHPFMAEDRYDGAIALDEASFVSIDSPSMAWAPRGRRAAKRAPTRRARVSLLLAIDASGVVAYDIRKGSFKSDSYAAFLHRLPAGRTVLADNLSVHKSAAARQAAAHRGLTLVFTPPYCPWFNPTEYVFSKTKAAYRRARLSGADDFVADVRDAIACVTGADCLACFEHARRARQRELEKSRGVA